MRSSGVRSKRGTGLAAADVALAVERAASVLRATLRDWYPQHGNNAPAERNFTAQLVRQLDKVPEMSFWLEPSIGASAAARLDLAAYHAPSATLIAVEAKRYLETESAALIAHDHHRLSAFAFIPRWPGARAPEVHHRRLVIITSTLSATHAAWWRNPLEQHPHRIRKTAPWTKLRQVLLAGEAQRGEAVVQDDPRRYLLWWVS